MTTAFFSADADTHTVTISGHAEYSDPDIVCAAASMLTCTLISALSGSDGFKLRQKDGGIFLKAERSALTDIQTETIKKGFRLLASAYPKNIRYKEEPNEDQH